MSGSEPGASLADFERALDEMARATDRLLETVDNLAEADLRGPSLLPGWTRAHVLTHLARNADGFVNLASWARTGDETPMYEGGREARAAGIEAGAGRHLGDIRLDLADAAERLLEAFTDFPLAGLQREVQFGSGAQAYGWELPLIRTREVEIHHVDVAAAYTATDWPDEFVVRTLDQLAPQFLSGRDTPVAILAAGNGDARWQVADSGPVLSGPPYALLAWLVGRSDGATLTLQPPGPVPPAPVWG